MPKFKVSRTDSTTSSSPRDVQSQDSHPAGNGEADHVNGEQISLTLDQEEGGNDRQKNLYLYEEDMKQMPRVATFLNSVLRYHPTLPNEKECAQSKKQPKKAKLGVILGVFLPTVQHIFGVLMFVRLAYIVGMMGVVQSFFMVFMCCTTTFVTAISMSAIATNGMVQAGGSYFMISRNLGPECGGAVGICFYLANTFATDLYILGGIEILLQYLAPQLAIFGDIHKNPFNNFRVYGTVIIILLTLIVAFGVRFVQLFAPFSLSCVLISVLCIFIGAFQASASTRDVWICLLGERLMVPPGAAHHGDEGGGHGNVTEVVANATAAAFAGIADWCTKNMTGDLYHRFCEEVNGTTYCDPYYTSHEPVVTAGIPGMASGVIARNAWSYYLKAGEVTPGEFGNPDREVTQELTSTFVILCAIYFPSVTGIMTGSNMSGDLKDPQKSIPVGTISAQLFCSFVYLSFVLFYGSTGEGALLRDKFGKSIGGALYASQLGWPSHWVVLIGAFCSTMGAALQCITSAPRLLQAIARDDIIPFLNFFKVTTANGEPLRALALTALIAEIGILIAVLEYVTPIIDVFFLMCYGFVNFTCVLQVFLKSPSWRPRFKYYHWTLSLLGVMLNLALSIIAGWYYALAAFSIAAFIYKYVEYKGGEKEWGDGIRGLSYSAAQKALLSLDEGDPHTKNWRPQCLFLCKLSEDLTPKYKPIFHFASQLKAGKGLSIFGSVIKGNYNEMVEEANRTKQMMKDLMKQDKIKGFAKVLVIKDVAEGLNVLVQTVGLGGLRHNTVVLCWPCGWHESTGTYSVFVDTVKAVAARRLALLIPRYINNFPTNKERLSGSIDVWWIVHDGGLLILLSFLLKQHKVWKNCKIRIFTVAQITDNSIQLKKDLELFLYQLRISAEVHVEEMYDSDISAYTVERTLDMEKRTQMLQELRLKSRRLTHPIILPAPISNAASNTPIPKIEVQEILDASHNPSTTRVEAETSQPTDASSVPSFTISTHEESDDENQNQNSVGAKAAENMDNKKDMDTLKVKQGEKASDSPKDVHFTFSPSAAKELLKQRSRENKLMRMHTAVKLNAAIKQHSAEAELVIVNFPAPPAKLSAEENYMEYLEVLTEGLFRVLMVRGSGQEVVTIYS